VADDIPPLILKALGSLAGKGASMLWDYLQKFKPVRSVTNFLTGNDRDLNDDPYPR